MNREIKFRAWDESKKVMHYNFQFIKSGNEGNDWIIFISDKQPLGWDDPFTNPYFQQQLKIMQFIRVLNGIDMYENDIIQTDTINCFADYNEELDCYGARQFIGGATVSFDNNWKVIGNIYENPELAV